MIEIGARVEGSQAAVLSTLRDQKVWEELREVYESCEENQGTPFPLAAPNRDQVRYFRKRLLDVPDWFDALQPWFQRIAVAQAKELGNLAGGVDPDWTNPSLRHTLIGDGMVLKPPTDVVRRVDPITGEEFFVGSRGVKPRLAPQLTDLSEDGKAHLRGLNMVTMTTPTRYGPVVLGTSHAVGAEQWPALDLLDALAALAGDGIHNLLYDRVFHGWLNDYTVAKHRVRVFNKSHADKSRGPGKVDEDTTTQRVLADRALRRMASDDLHDRRLAELPEDHFDHLGPQQRDRYLAAVRSFWRTDDLLDIYYSGAPQPIGVSLYPSTAASDSLRNRPASKREKVEIVRSEPLYFGKHVHDTDAGSCVHEMFVDDGALHTAAADPTEGYLVKVATARCISSTPRLRANGLWGSTETWLMPCPDGDFEITTTWDPQGDRFTPDTPAEVDRTPEDMVLNELRPISRSDHQEFADIANFRNHAESFNNWYQRTLPHFGRAASYTVGGQQHDLLAAACQRNANTFAAWMDDDED
jgi:hypothetical protein